MSPTARVPLRLLALTLLAYSLAHLANNTLLAAAPVRDALLALQRASGGLIEPMLVRSWLVLAVFLALVLGLGRRAPREFGWRAGAFTRGLATWVAAWALLNGLLLAWSLARGQELAWHPMWTRFGLGAVVGGVLAQAAGHALVEDTAFRAFFLPQLRARLAHLGAPAAAALAVVGAALLFGAAHLPTRALVKSPGGMALLAEQGHFLSAGIALGLVWLASQNLGVVVALHVLLEDPAPLVAADGVVLNRAVLVVIAAFLAVAALLQRRAARALRAEPELETKRAA